MRLHWTVDERRVQKALAGDRQAAGRLVDDHYPGLVRFLVHLTGAMDEAEEIAQESFVRAWQRLDTYGARSSFKTWIHRIAYREFLAYRERARAFEPLDEASHAGRGDFSDGLLDALSVERAVLTLPVDLRVAFLLVHVQGLSAREVGDVLGIPRGTVLSRTFAARERLARLLDPTGGTPVPKPREGAPPYETSPLAP